MWHPKMDALTFRCLGCGDDIEDSKGNRLLSSTPSQHVTALWKIEEEINRRATPYATSLAWPDHLFSAGRYRLQYKRPAPVLRGGLATPDYYATSPY